MAKNKGDFFKKGGRLKNMKRIFLTSTFFIAFTYKCGGNEGRRINGRVHKSRAQEIESRVKLKGGLKICK